MEGGVVVHATDIAANAINSDRLTVTLSVVILWIPLEIGKNIVLDCATAMRHRSGGIYHVRESKFYLY